MFFISYEVRFKKFIVNIHMLHHCQFQHWGDIGKCSFPANVTTVLIIWQIFKGKDRHVQVHLHGMQKKWLCYVRKLWIISCIFQVITILLLHCTWLVKVYSFNYDFLCNHRGLKRDLGTGEICELTPLRKKTPMALCVQAPLFLSN